ncbi:MAG: nucleotidyltransferase family protein [Pseudomonadota bacterium]
MNAPATVIVLAAGQASRFVGVGHKLAQALDGNDDSGRVLSVTLRNAIASGLPVLVVTSAALAPLVHQQVAARDVVVMPPSRNGGMGDSISAAVSARADASGWLLLPADMPRVRSTTLQQVALALQTHAVAYAQHRGLRGHPVGFSSELFSELVALTGDEGARRLVARYPAQAIEVDDPGVLVDIDTVQDLAALRAVKGGSALPTAPQQRL